MRGAGQVQREAQDVTRAEQRLDAVLQEIQTLEQELEDEMRKLDTGTGPETEPLEKVTVRAKKKKDVEVRQVALVWQ